MTDSWSVTPPSPQEFPHSATDGVRALYDKIDRQKRELDEMRNNLLATSGIRVTPEGMVVQSSLRSADFDGDLATGDAGTTGWAMNASRVAIGELFLRPGSVGNDILANPIAAVSGYSNEDTFAVTTTPIQRGSWTVTVPAGYTTGFVISDVTLGVYNQTGATQYAYVRAYVTGPGGYVEWSSRSMITLATGFVGTVNADLTRAIDYVTLAGGDTLTFYAEVSATASMAAHANNFATGECLVLFTR